MIQNSKDDDFLIFNPDTLWNKDYVEEIKKMQDFYFSNKLNNILLLANKKLSFDKNLKGDFKLTNNLLKKDDNNDFIYIGCQILNKKLFEKYTLNGFESSNKFFHLTNLETFKKLKDF